MNNNPMTTPNVSPDFTVEDIRKVREWNEQRRRGMTHKEIIADIEGGANEFTKLVEASRKMTSNANQ